MVLGWRRAFCTSIPKDQERDSPIIKDKSDPSPSPRLTSRFGGFFSTPSTPRLHSHPVAPPSAAVPSNSAPQSPRLHCKTRDSHRSSTPSSPRSPSTFSLLKSSMRLSKSRWCVICLLRVKTGQGTAIFTAECGHSFHFPCIAANVRKQGSLTCPVCNSAWKEMHLLQSDYSSNFKNDARCILKVYNDDEPLSSPTWGARFNPIPESDETEEENEEFPGFFVGSNVIPAEMKARNVEVALSSGAAVVSVGKRSETYVVVLKIKAPAATARRAPVDLVTVLNVSRSMTGDKLHLMKKAMRLMVSSLSSADRLSIVAFSNASKRLLPLRRMNTGGRRGARRIIDAVVALDGAATSANDSLKKAAKVIEDRREKNPTASIVLFSDGHHSGPLVSSTTFPDMDIPVHFVNLNACLNAPPDDTFAKCISGLFNVVIQDLKIHLGFTSGSSPAEISAVYSNKGKPVLLGSGSSWCRVGDFHSEEERELLIELKVPSSFGGAQQRLLSVRCSYNDPSTRQPMYEKERRLAVPRPRSGGSSTRDIQRLRCLFITTRALAESRRLLDRNDVGLAHHMLASARALVLQTAADSGEEFLRRLEAQLTELSWKRKEEMQQARPRRRNNHEREAGHTEDKPDPLTPTSAWRAAERLAKVAIMRKSLNRVSDLHGFEDARF
ncbi:putative E3 ubiquitin-protein ligase EDA40 [Sesamum alatum]|uniref:E3 ubiquitin-protein ligase EDA40 n=1 Tax=Sesamum alatum TaxID=300844 RepID=A0AAE2CLN3_9LAMI|nr:putative E3 ubiquitin-protein ligase EDA40 [Sesamum alatum]